MPNMLPGLLLPAFHGAAAPLIISGNTWREDLLAPFLWRRIAGAFLD